MMAIARRIVHAFRRLRSVAYYKLSQMTGHLPPVRAITWEITDACNSRCRLCNIWKHGKSPDVLTLEEIKKVFSDPLFRNLERVLITGGEAVLRKDMLDILIFIHEKLPKVKRPTLSTNALAPDRVLSVVKGALEAGMDIDLGISLDGVGEHHDMVRGVPGNFQKVDYLLDNLLALKKDYGERLTFTVGQTLHPMTLPYVDETMEYARKKGVHHFLQLYDEAPYYHNEGGTRLSPEDTDRLMAAVRKDRPSFHNEMLLRILRDKIIRFDCFTMRTFFILRCNGDVMPCLRLCDRRIGNVRTESPSAIWHGKAAAAVREEIRNCRGCGNTWATDWSCEANYLPFADMLKAAEEKQRLLK